MYPCPILPSRYTTSHDCFSPLCAKLYASYLWHDSSLYTSRNENAGPLAAQRWKILTPLSNNETTNQGLLEGVHPQLRASLLCWRWRCLSSRFKRAITNTRGLVSVLRQKIVIADGFLHELMYQFNFILKRKSLCKLHFVNNTLSHCFLLTLQTCWNLVDSIPRWIGNDSPTRLMEAKYGFRQG